MLRPEGTLIVFETLGTGYRSQTPPDAMGEYLGYLEDEGLSRRWIRTDYRFESVAEAASLTSFFFGEPLVDRLTSVDPVILPECTEVWSLNDLSAGTRISAPTTSRRRPTIRRKYRSMGDRES